MLRSLLVCCLMAPSAFIEAHLPYEGKNMIQKEHALVDGEGNLLTIARIDGHDYLIVIVSHCPDCPCECDSVDLDEWIYD